MDPKREIAIGKYISAVLCKDVEDILDLKDGLLFMEILDKLDQSDRNKEECDSVLGRWHVLDKFLRDYYGEDGRIFDYLKYSSILNGGNLPEGELKIELAKIAVVLLGIGVLDKNGEYFMKSATEVSLEYQKDILAIIQSVVMPGTAEVVLTNKIEEVLKESDEDCMNSLLATPHPEKALRRTPGQTNVAVLDCSARDISSPFRALDIRSPSASPIVDFMQSPHFIQKSLLKEKDRRINQLREQLNEEMDLRNEAQCLLQSRTEECEHKDEEIAKLKERLGELESIEKSHTELQERVLHYKEKEEQMDLVKTRAELMQKYKDDFEILKKENSIQADEIGKLRLKIKSYQVECSKNKDLPLTVEELKEELKELRDQLAERNKLQVEWKEERKSLHENLVMMKDRNDKLRQDLEEVQNVEPKGESMGVVLDLQMAEQKQCLAETQKELQSLLTELETSKKDISVLREQAQFHEENMTRVKETNKSLSAALKIERDTNAKWKKRIDTHVSKYDVISMKFNNLQKENEATVSEVARLKMVLQETQQQLLDFKHKQKLGGSPSVTFLESIIGDSPSSQSSGSSPESLPTLSMLFAGNNSSSSDPRESMMETGDKISSSDKALSSTDMTNDSNRSYFKADRRNKWSTASLPAKCEFIKPASGVRPHLKRSLSRFGPYSRCSNTSLQSIGSCADLRNCLNTTRNLAESSVMSQNSTLSLESVKELLPGVLPNAMSCANEPDDHDFEWDRLSMMSTVAEENEQSRNSEKMNSKYKGGTRTSKRKNGVNSCDESETQSPVKQKKSGGTVIYFPLNPSGPIYPAPRPGVQTRRTSGKFTSSSTENLKPDTVRARGSAQVCMRITPFKKKKKSKSKDASCPQTSNKYTIHKKASQKLNFETRQKQL